MSGENLRDTGCQVLWVIGGAGGGKIITTAPCRSANTFYCKSIHQLFAQEVIYGRRHQSRRGFSHPFLAYPRGRRVECQICPRFCKLHENQRGLCFVRGNLGGRSCCCLMAVPAASASTHREEAAQPFPPGTPIFSFGTAGCNLACKFCQNWTSASRGRWIA